MFISKGYKFKFFFFFFHLLGFYSFSFNVFPFKSYPLVAVSIREILKISLMVSLSNIKSVCIVKICRYSGFQSYKIQLISFRIVNFKRRFVLNFLFLDIFIQSLNHLLCILFLQRIMKENHRRILKAGIGSLWILWSSIMDWKEIFYQFFIFNHFTVEFNMNYFIEWRFISINCIQNFIVKSFIFWCIWIRRHKTCCSTKYSTRIFQDKIMSEIFFQTEKWTTTKRCKFITFIIIRPYLGMYKLRI